MFPHYEITCERINQITGKIEVYWVKNNEKKLVWSDTKQNTQNNHAKISELLASSHV
jgi:hypothetical protein